jgi:hypothetical protein
MATVLRPAGRRAANATCGIVTALVIFGASAIFASEGDARTAADAGPAERFEQVLLDTQRVKIGSRVIEVLRNEGFITITEKLSVRNPIGEFGWEATVVYKTKPQLSPVSGESQTFANGKPVLKGTVKIDRGEVSFTALGKDIGRSVGSNSRFDGPERTAGHSTEKFSLLVLHRPVDCAPSVC